MCATPSSYCAAAMPASAARLNSPPRPRRRPVSPYWHATPMVYSAGAKPCAADFSTHPMPALTSRGTPSPARSIRPSFDCDEAEPCSAALVYHSAAFTASLAYPRDPIWCNSPSAACASVSPASAFGRYHGEVLAVHDASLSENQKIALYRVPLRRSTPWSRSKEWKTALVRLTSRIGASRRRACAGGTALRRMRADRGRH